MSRFEQFDEVFWRERPNLKERFEDIFQTQFSLQSLASESGEARSLSAALLDFAERVGSDKGKILSEDLIKTRQQVLKGLQKQVEDKGLDPNSTSLNDLDLTQFVEQAQENGEVREVILDIIVAAVYTFVAGQSPDQISKIQEDNDYRRETEKRWRNNVRDYIAKAVIEKLGFDTQIQED